MNGSNVLEGRVELCINNAWGTVCTDSISEDDVEVICRTAGQLPPGMFQKVLLADITDINNIDIIVHSFKDLYTF